MAHLGAKIRALRTSQNLTLPALASAAGISKGLLSTIETDPKSNPSLSTLYKIVEGLGCTVADILGTERVVIKRVPPDEHASWRAELATAFRGKELDPHILDAMQLLRNRKASKVADIEHWKFLYSSIENSFKK